MFKFKKREKKKKEKISFSDMFYALKEMDTTPRDIRVLAYKKILSIIRIFVIIFAAEIPMWLWVMYCFATPESFGMIGVCIIMIVAIEIDMIPFRMYQKKKWDKKSYRFIMPMCFILSLSVALLGAKILTIFYGLKE